MPADGYPPLPRRQGRDAAAAVAVWMFGKLGARAGDELVDLCPGSGAISEAWRRYTAHRRVTDGVGGIAARGLLSSGGPAPVAQRYDLTVVCREQAPTCPVNGARCKSTARVDVGCTAGDAEQDVERAA